MILRKSWDTAVKHYVRNGLFENLPEAIQRQVASSNKSRWIQESDSKYSGCEVADFINQELELIKRINQSSNIQKINRALFTLSDVFHTIIDAPKKLKSKLRENKDIIVNTIENLKSIVSVETAIKIFGISRACYQSYKTLVMNKCDASYFLWCVKRYPNQLLKVEVLKIKKYMEDEQYRYWSKSSIYLRAVRDGSVAFSLSTWYKYCKLLGFSSNGNRRRKKVYSAIISTKPNELWCCDVTILKTADGVKHYIHILIDHFSKMILGYSIEKANSGLAIKKLLEKAYLKYQPNEPITLLSDGGTENTNTTVAEYLNSDNVDIKHLIAQRDVSFSNSTIEMVNKVIKHQFLLPLDIYSGKRLASELDSTVISYNEVRPQFALRGCVPFEVHNGDSIDFSRFTVGFTAQKVIRVQQNQKNKCGRC